MKVELLTIATLGLATFFSACYHGGYSSSKDASKSIKESEPNIGVANNTQILPEKRIEPQEELYIM